ncbi:MAG: nucleotidyltransferase domain-containing protein [Acidobacteriota bacterium]
MLEKDKRVIFAYLYGSSLKERKFNDVDIAVYSIPKYNELNLSSDIKIALSQRSDISPDRFDVRVINRVDNLLYLKDVLEGELLVDKNPEIRCDFIEKFSMKYRESESILKEAFSI